MGRKKKPEAEPRFARVEVTVTDGMEGFGSAFGSKPTGARATFTITDGYTTLERSYRLPSDAELSMEDQARVRDLFIVHRWQELINNLFPHLWDHPLIGGPEKGPFTDRNPWETDPAKVVDVEPPSDAGADYVDGDLRDRIMNHISTEGEHAAPVVEGPRVDVYDEPKVFHGLRISNGYQVVEIPKATLSISKDEEVGDDLLLGDNTVLSCMPREASYTFELKPVSGEYVTLLFGLSEDAINAEEDIRTSGEQERLECKVWGDCIYRYRTQELLDRAVR
jgi:hypothetical protein